MRISTSLPYRSARYNGFESYNYLEAGFDFEVFDLASDLDRVPPFDLGLTTAQYDRTIRLMKDNIVISLHDHPQLQTTDPANSMSYIRSGRQHTAFRGLSRSGLTAVFDNLLGGTGGPTSSAGWKFDDIVADIAMRTSDVDHQDFIRIGRRVEDIVDAHHQDRLALILSLEAATPIENEVDRLDLLYGLGVRQIGIAYSESNSLGGGLKERHDGGLTAFGERAVRRMNKLGMSIDISHSGDRTSLDTIRASSAPVCITHAGARAVWPTPRMKPDEVIRACADSGGVIGIEAAPHTTLSRAHPIHSIDSVMDHFEYCVDLVGIDHVTFGPDTIFGDHVASHRIFAASLGVHDTASAPDHPQVDYVAGLENPSECFHNIVGWLVKNGYSDQEVAAVTGGNVLRVLNDVWY